MNNRCAIVFEHFSLLNLLKNQSLLDFNFKMCTVVLIQGLSKLVDLRGDLESLEKDSLLSLESDVSWPSDESGEILLGLDISTDSEASGGRFEKRVSLLLNLLGNLGCFLGSLRLFVTNKRIT